MKPVKIDILGTEPVLKPENQDKPMHDNDIWTPSDHFGLRCTVDLKEDGEFLDEEVKPQRFERVFSCMFSHKRANYT